MPPAVDVVTVYHCDSYRRMALHLRGVLAELEQVEHRFVGVDNTVVNRGFGKACNLGVKASDAPVLLFLNPDVAVQGPFLQLGVGAIGAGAVIAGERFGRDQAHVEWWGLSEWVCGAAMFVSRPWFEEVGGFDERFEWGWEETDLCRQAETTGQTITALSLPLTHRPVNRNRDDRIYKKIHIREGRIKYAAKWGDVA